MTEPTMNLPYEFGVGLQRLQDFGRLATRDVEDDAVHAPALEAGERVGVRRRLEDGDGDRGRVASRRFGAAPEFYHLVLKARRHLAASDGQPAVTELDDAVERSRTIAAHDDRRMRFLDRLR